MDPDDLLTASQVAELLGCTEQTIRKRAASGDLPFIRLWGESNGPIRFSRKQLIAHLESRSHSSKPPAESCL